MPSEDYEEDDHSQPDLERGYSSHEMHYGAQAYGQGNQLNMNGGFHVKGDLYCNFCHFFSCSFGIFPSSLRDTWHRFHTWIRQRPIRNPLILAAILAISLAFIATIVDAVKDFTHDDNARAANTAAVLGWHGFAGSSSTTCTLDHNTTACPMNNRRVAPSTVCVASADADASVTVICGDDGRCHITGCLAGRWAYPAEGGSACAPGMTCGSWVEGESTTVSRCVVSETTGAAVTMTTTTINRGDAVTAETKVTGPAAAVAVEPRMTTCPI